MQPGTDHELIFAHEGNARVAASAIMAGMAALLIGGSFLTPGPQVKASSLGPYEAGNATPVRVIGGPSPDNVRCEQQVWPNIAQRCLVRTQARATPAAKPPPNKSTAALDNAELSPLTAVAVDHRPSLKDDATSGQGVQEDTAVLREQDTTRSPEATADTSRTEEAPPPMEHRQVYRHIRFPFHLRLGGFRF